MKNLSQKAEKFQESIFATLTRQAQEAKAINLAQGFPDFPTQAPLVKELKNALDHQAHQQYAPLPGALRLRKAISSYLSKFHQLSYSPEEITVTSGATEAIFCTILGTVNPGDEVILFEPFYDSYKAAIELAGAIAIPVTLEAPNFTFCPKKLGNAFSSKTKLVLLNTPHNPTGRVLTENELHQVCELVIANDTYLMSDEVYEFLLFDQHQHRPPASFPGMRERTITISSFGKTFEMTGLKIGHACAPEHLTRVLRNIHQFTTFCANHPAQSAAAWAFENLDSHLPHFKKSYQEKRDLFVDGLEKIGFTPFRPEGTYFVLVPTPKAYAHLSDIHFCQLLIKECGVAAIPPSAFYMESRDGENYLRFCFAKTRETLEAALKGLSKLSI